MGRYRAVWWMAAASWLIAVPAAAAEYSLVPGQLVVGATGIFVAKEDDVLLDVARQYDLGFTQLMAANHGVDPWRPGKGRRVTLPTRYILPDAPHQGIVINLAEWRLFYFPPGGRSLETYPIGIGVVGEATPLGVTTVTGKEPNPAWYPTPAIRLEDPDLPSVIPPGPDNPLGAFALHLGWPGYLIHGTNKPDGVGRNVSHGCIRLYPEDIDRLFHEVALGVRVQVVRQDVEAAWIGDSLFVEIHPSKPQADQIDMSQAISPEIPEDLIARVTAVAGTDASLVDWDAVRQAGLDRTGLLVEVARRPSSLMGRFDLDQAKGRRN